MKLSQQHVELRDMTSDLQPFIGLWFLRLLQLWRMRWNPNHNKRCHSSLSLWSKRLIGWGIEEQETIPGVTLDLAPCAFQLWKARTSGLPRQRPIDLQENNVRQQIWAFVFWAFEKSALPVLLAIYFILIQPWPQIRQQPFEEGERRFWWYIGLSFP